MIPKMVITVIEAGTPAARTFAFKIFLNEEVIADQLLSPIDSQEVREISRQYASIFEEGYKGNVKDYFDILGDSLFHIFFERSWQEIESKISQGADLVVATEIREVLLLPWEILRFPSPLGFTLSSDERFSIRRLPKLEKLQAFSGELSPGPLRVLFIACEPLDYEKEAQAILKAAEGLDIALEICDLGTFEEFGRLSNKIQPHFVHLVGLAKMKNGQAQFSFQGEGGLPDTRTPEEIAGALAASETQCILFGGDQRETLSTLDLLCQEMTQYLPLVLGWNASVDSARTYYTALALGKTIDEVLSQVRREMLMTCHEHDKICALPVLYSLADQSSLFDAKKRDRIAFDIDEMHPLPGMARGFSEGFVNRRKDLQRLTSSLREGIARTLIITGPAGSGKITLATKIAHIFKSEGYEILPIYSSPHNPLTAIRFLEAIIGKLTKMASAEGDGRRLKDPDVPMAERLENVLDILKRRRLLVLCDGLELDPKTGRIKDPELAVFYPHMLTEMDSTRVIITSQSLPADMQTLPSHAWEWQLGGLSEAAFVKYLIQDEAIGKMYRNGEINYLKLHDFYVSGVGLPYYLAQMHKAWNGKDFKAYDEILFEDYDSLNQESRLALAQAAVYDISISLAGLAAVTGLIEEKLVVFASDWRKLSLVQNFRNLWYIPQSVRSSFLPKLGYEQRTRAERAAGNFLREFAEKGRSSELELSRLDCLIEARGHYLAGEDLENALAVTNRICSYFERRGYFHEIIRLNEEFLVHDKQTMPLNWIARAYLDLKDFEKAQEWYQRAVKAGPDGVAYHGLGRIYLHQGKYELARESFQKAVEICNATGNLEGESAARHGLASIYEEQKEDEAALQELQKVFKIQELLGDLRSKAATLNEMAMLDFRRQNFESARQKLLESIEILKQLKDPKGEALALYHLASIDMEKSDMELARDEFQKSLVLKRLIDDKAGQALILHNLGLIEAQAGNKDKASESFFESLRIFQELGDKAGEAGAFFQLGVLAIQRDKIPEGLRMMALSAIILRGMASDDVRNVEPFVERVAKQLNYSQDQFLNMIQEVTRVYRNDRGWGLIQAAWRKID